MSSSRTFWILAVVIVTVTVDGVGTVFLSARNGTGVAVRSLLLTGCSQQSVSELQGSASASGLPASPLRLAHCHKIICIIHSPPVFWNRETRGTRDRIPGTERHQGALALGIADNLISLSWLLPGAKGHVCTPGPVMRRQACGPNSWSMWKEVRLWSALVCNVYQMFLFTPYVQFQCAGKDSPSPTVCVTGTKVPTALCRFNDWASFPLWPLTSGVWCRSAVCVRRHAPSLEGAATLERAGNGFYCLVPWQGVFLWPNAPQASLSSPSTGWRFPYSSWASFSLSLYCQCSQRSC